MFIPIVIFLAVISFLWALWTLKELNKHTKITQSVKKKLEKGRVVYHADSSSSASSTTSSISLSD